MNFQIFIVGTQSSWVYDLKPKKAGIHHLDKARKKAGHAVKLDESISWTREKSEVINNIPEKLARKSGRFENSSSITVEVPRYFLHAFMKETLREYKKPSCGKTHYISREVNRKKLLKAWEKAGFPLVWHSLIPL